MGAGACIARAGTRPAGIRPLRAVTSGATGLRVGHALPRSRRAPAIARARGRIGRARERPASPRAARRSGRVGRARERFFLTVAEQVSVRVRSALGPRAAERGSRRRRGTFRRTGGRPAFRRRGRRDDLHARLSVDAGDDDFRPAARHDRNDAGRRRRARDRRSAVGLRLGRRSPGMAHGGENRCEEHGPDRKRLDASHQTRARAHRGPPRGEGKISMATL